MPANGRTSGERYDEYPQDGWIRWRRKWETWSLHSKYKSLVRRHPLFGREQQAMSSSMSRWISRERLDGLRLSQDSQLDDVKYLMLCLGKYQVKLGFKNLLGLPVMWMWWYWAYASPSSKFGSTLTSVVLSLLLKLLEINCIDSSSKVWWKDLMVSEVDDRRWRSALLLVDQTSSRWS